jgi:FdhE protein
MARHPHAEEILGFYVAVLEAQEPVWRWAGSALRAAPPPASPRLAVEALDPVVLQARFRELLGPLVVVAPPSLSEVGAGLLEQPARALAESVAVALGSEAEAADGVAGQALLFFGSAFLEPIVMAARGEPGTASAAGSAATAGRADSRASHSPPAGGTDGTTTCRFCGRAPLVAVLLDDAQTKGGRLAVCGFCTERWTMRRAVCLACGEGDTARLLHHVSESFPQVRVEECGSCRTYHKTIDLRVEGRAVPVVDELASVELDLWAQERGLEKLTPNLLGL